MKKTLALALVLALSLSLASTAFAEEPGKEQDTGAGTISFRDGSAPEIIDPPPEFDSWNISPSLNLDFGSQQISGSNRTYDSYEHARTEDTKLAGIVILNETAQENWVLQVGMTGFFIGTNPTMEGFELELVPHSQYTNRPGTPQTVNTVTLEGGGAPQTIMTITPVATIGANWKGLLEVLGGSVTQTGDAKAEMTWSIVIPL